MRGFVTNLLIIKTGTKAFPGNDFAMQANVRYSGVRYNRYKRNPLYVSWGGRSWEGCKSGNRGEGGKGECGKVEFGLKKQSEAMEQGN